MPESGRHEDFATRICRAVAESRTDGCDPPGRRVWRALGRAGLIAELYQWTGSRPYGEGRPVASRLREMLAVLDTECGVGVTLSVCVQVASALPILLAEADGGIIDRVGRQTASGEAVTALGVTDAGAAGSDLPGLASTVRLAEDHLVLTGGKRWITGACFADNVLVLARHKAGAHFTSFTWVLVPVAVSGVTVEAADTPFFAGSGVGHLRFDAVRLSREHVVGRVGQGLVGFARHIATERLAGGLWATALARRALDETHTKLTTRIVRGHPLWENAAVRQRFAGLLLQQLGMDALCRRLAGTIEQRADERARRPAGPAAGAASAAGAPGPLLASMLVKAGTAEALERILAECAQLQGADGFAEDGIQRLRAEAAMFGIAGGTTETMLDGIADHAAELLKAPCGPEAGR